MNVDIARNEKHGAHDGRRKVVAESVGQDQVTDERVEAEEVAFGFGLVEEGVCGV